jgi:hypothetical protein
VFSGQAFSGQSIIPIGFELAYYSNYVGVIFAAFATGTHAPSHRNTIAQQEFAVWSSSLSTRDHLKTSDIVSAKPSERRFKAAKRAPDSVDGDIEFAVHNCTHHDTCSHPIDFNSSTTTTTASIPRADEVKVAQDVESMTEVRL